jgi:hypothetical protein
VRHAGGGVRAHLRQREALGVDALEEPDARAEQHGRERDRELVDEAGAQVLLDRLGAARDADVAVAGDRAGAPQRALDAVADEVEGGAARGAPTGRAGGG